MHRLLRPDHTEVDAQAIDVERMTGEGGHRVHDQQRVARFGQRRDRLERVEDAAGGLGMYHRDETDIGRRIERARDSLHAYG